MATVKIMLKKLLSNNFKWLFVFSLIIFNFQTAFCNFVEILFLPHSFEETVFMQSIQVLSEGENSCGNNPGGCGMENKKSFSFGCTYWRMQESLSSLALFLPKKFGNLAVKLKYTNFGETDLVGGEPIEVKKESLYSIILHTSLGKEIFLPGLFLGTDVSVGNIKLDNNLTLAGAKFGFIYIINFISTELHLGGVFGSSFCDSKNLEFYGVGFKYFVTEYNTFLNVALNKNNYNFVTANIESEVFKNFIFICGYETSIDESLTNYSFGIKSIQKNFNVSLGTRYNQELGWTISVGLGIKR